MKTVVLGPPPQELEQLIQRRRALGLDKFDEVWEGNYHVAPMAHPKHGYLQTAVAVLLHQRAEATGLVGSGPFNLGYPNDFRVPDLGYWRARPDALYVDTAAIVVEILSPDDETFEKMPFYASRGVDEVFVVNPNDHVVSIFSLSAGTYVRTDRSDLLGIDSRTLECEISWP